MDLHLKGLHYFYSYSRQPYSSHDFFKHCKVGIWEECSFRLLEDGVPWMAVGSSASSLAGKLRFATVPPSKQSSFSAWALEDASQPHGWPNPTVAKNWVQQIQHNSFLSFSTVLATFIATSPWPLDPTSHVHWRLNLLRSLFMTNVLI